MQFVALSANNYATVSRGEGGTSDRSELQKGWRTRDGGGVAEVYIFVAKTPVAPLSLDSRDFSEDSEDAVFLTLAILIRPCLAVQPPPSISRLVSSLRAFSVLLSLSLSSLSRNLKIARSITILLPQE